MQIATAITAKEQKHIESTFHDLVHSIEERIDSKDRVNLENAFKMASRAHAMQRRKSGEPYILHPIEVARICAHEIGLGPTAVVCALLHDVVEDSSITHDEIVGIFGEKIASIVDGLTKLKGTHKTDSPQAENFKKVLSTLVEDVRVVLIKMADRLHNMRTIGSMPKHKQLRIAAETNYVYSPLAHRLGLYNLRTEFQDLCMKVTDPVEYAEISKKIKDSKKERNQYIKSFIKPLLVKLDELDVKYRITGRPKSISSVHNKIKQKKVPFEQIYDLFAIRIIVDVPLEMEKSICWQVYSIVTDIHTPIPERLKDWITTPKSNGYESLHTSVVGPKGRFVEVQIRSERMDEIAERGFAAHWKYKGILGIQNFYNNWLDNVRDILDNSQGDAVEFMSDFKTNLFHEEVYVYTPRGDMLVLPKGATALDFAFHIHTDVGYHATSIKVNKKLVPMGYKLQNGDQLQVFTQKNQKPNENWLKMVITGKARSKIRGSMKEERRKQGELGQEALQRKLKNLKVDYEEGIDVLVKFFGLKSRPDLYFEVATGRIHPQEFNKLFEVVRGKLVPRKDENEQEVKEEVKKSPKIVGVPKLFIDGEPADQYKYSLATCCNPVQGDDIFAYINSKNSIRIHRTNCPNATHLMANYGYRILKSEWAESTNTSFVVDLLITGVDDGVGVIEKLSKQISSNLGLNIRALNIAGHEGFFEAKVSVLVLNKDQMNLAIKVLKGTDGISNVTRIE